MISNLLMATGSQAPISTIDLVDPFGDGSGVALYKFDGDAAEESGTYNGTASNFTYGTGKFGQCAVLNGTNSVFRLPYSSFPFIALDSFSFSIWIKRNNASEAGIMYINNLTGSVVGFISFNSSNNIVFYDGFYDHYSSLVCGNLSVGTWEHLVFTQQGDTRNVYQNGVNVGTSTSSLTRSVYTYLEMFTLSVNGTFYNSFNGSIDQFRIFNRALTQEEVTALYNESVESYTPYVPQPSTIDTVDYFRDGSGVALYKFDGDATDESGNYDGTFRNITYDVGKFGQCVKSTSTDSYVSFGIHQFNVPKTLSFWAKGSAVVENAENNCQYPTIKFIPTSFRLFNGTTTVINLPLSYDTSVFVHICVTINYPSVVVYINGVMANSGSMSNQAGTTPFDFGLWDVPEYHETLNGSIDQFRIFNRALTQTEVTALYNEGQ